MVTRKIASKPTPAAKATKTARTKTAKPARAAAAPKPAAKAAAAPAKTKQKLVRDSFTIPKSEYTVLGELKQRAVQLARPAKKSELLRAGINALNAMADSAFLAALRAVPSLKTGRPKEAAAPAKKA
jgi:hypothetical protein